MSMPTSKHNVIADEVGQVRQIESEIATTEAETLDKRIAQGKLLASLKNNIQGIEPWETWVPANLGFTRKTADNYINLANWYYAHFEEGKADKEAHLAEIAKSGGKSEYQHCGFTSFNAVYELLSKRARKMKAAMKPHAEHPAEARSAKAAKLSPREAVVALQEEKAKLVRAVISLDPTHPVLQEIAPIPLQPAPVVAEISPVLEELRHALAIEDEPPLVLAPRPSPVASPTPKRPRKPEAPVQREVPANEDAPIEDAAIESLELNPDWLAAG